MRAAALAVALAAAAVFLAAARPAAAACGNAIVCENQLPGTPQSTWDLPDPNGGDPTIQGFATDISVDEGDTVDFKIDTDAVSYRVDIYRLGWYGGDGARLVDSFTKTLAFAQSQPACLTDSTGLVDCGNWAVSASWQVPADAVSGVYVARLMRLDTLGASHVVFVVRDDASRSDLLFQTSDETWQAYNRYGGNSLYTGSHTALGNPTSRAYKVSYNRPFTTRAYQPTSWIFGPEYAAIRFLERNGYDVTYTTGLDADRRGDLIRQHRVYLSVGHDEYWSGGQRANVLAARDHGVDLAFLSGNESFWKTRWEPSIDGSGTADRTLVCYKESAAGQDLDPTSSFTGNWRDTALQRQIAPGDPVSPENGLTGQLYETSFREDAITVPAADAGLRFWRNTSIASLTGSQTATLPTGVLGYEWDVDAANGVRPAGEFDLSSSTFAVNSVFDNGGNPGTITHSLSEYRAASGALVFGAGTIQWAYGLDGTHDRTTSGTVVPDARMQQATVNVLADMGAQPQSPMSGLVAATASTDTTAPTSFVTSPAPGATLTAGTPVTVTGTASDTGGGVVAGVEVSVDGGHTWQEATGRESWRYTFTPAATGPAEIASRAVDDSGNLEGNAAACPCSIWSDAARPATDSSGDPNPIEVGVRFRSDLAGYVTGIRFYKGAGNTGTHVGHLWSADGTQLATVSFAGESASGWQQATFNTPVPIAADTTYVASYYAPNGNYSLDRPYFTSGVDRPPLHALADGFDGPDGVYLQGAGGFPAQTFDSSNYWVDVVFSTSGADTTAPTVAGVSPAAGQSGVSTSTNAIVRFGEAMAPASITATTLQLRDPANALVPAAVAYDASTSSATIDPNAPLAAGTTYTATVTGGAGGVTDAAGNALAADYSWSFTTAAVVGGCPCSIWPASATPATAANSDGNAYELGVRFRSDADGFVSGIRFYKGATNTGTHVGHLWTSAGVLLGTATFADETASGWQQVSFASPVAITANTTYVASYTDPNGEYALDRPYFTKAYDDPPLHALADGFDGADGVYGPPGSFPSSSYSSSNYWVDVVFTTGAADTTPPTVTSTSPAAGATGVAASIAPLVRFSEPLAASTVTSSTVVLRDAGGTEVAAAVAYDAGSSSATLTPSAPLAAAATYTVTVEGGAGGVTDLAGNPLAADYAWSFTTAAPVSCPCSVWSAATTPQTAATGDGSALELGMRFRSDLAGYVTGVRFYKGAGNTGTHLAHLWTATGTLLASATFAGETAAGWQQVAFASPVAIAAGTTYVVSYYAPSGHYALDRPYFTSTVDAAPLHALGDGVDGPNGVYLQGASGFPAQTYDASNYWVDVVFSTSAADTTPPAVTSTSPPAGATGVGASAAVVARFSEALAPASVSGSSFVLRDAGGSAVPASVAYDAASSSATLTPAAPLAASTVYTATVSGGTGGVTDLAGNPLAADDSWSFTTAAPVAGATCPCSLWSAATKPSSASASDSGSYELGVRFRSDAAGYVTGVRFYKGTGNTGTHVGSLWTNAGTRLARATFAGETATGWQQVGFATAVAIDADTTYVVSYSDPKGHYALDRPYFTSAFDAPPLHALADGFDGADGVYASAPGSFPVKTNQSSNYWVDLVFSRTPPPTVTAKTPPAGATGVSTGAAVSAAFSRAMDASTLTAATFTLTPSGGTALGATVAYDTASLTATLTPSAPLAAATKYTVALTTAAEAADGVPLSVPVTWTFTTAP